MEKDKQALNYTLKLISKRWYTTFEIRQKLELKQYTQENIEKTIQFLEEKKFLDDHRFAIAFIKDHQNFRHEGKFVITQKLIQKGITKDLINNIWSQITESENDNIEAANREITIAMEAISSKKRSYQSLEPEVAKRRLMSFLSRKGFTYDTIKKALANMDDEIYN